MRKKYITTYATHICMCAIKTYTFNYKNALLRLCMSAKNTIAILYKNFTKTFTDVY